MKFETYNKVRKFLYDLYFKFYHRLKVIGVKNIPNGPALVVSNHTGGAGLDILIISNYCHPTRNIQALIWERAYYIHSIYGKLVVGSGIPLWIQGGIRWKYINPYLHPKGSQYPGLVCMFPEGRTGSFAKRHTINQFFPGVVRIALKYKVPIVPVAQMGLHKVTPILKEIPKAHAPDGNIMSLINFPFKVTVEFGKPFELNEYYDSQLSKEEETWIANMIIRPKIADIRRKYTKVELARVELKMKKP